MTCRRRYRGERISDVEPHYNPGSAGKERAGSLVRAKKRVNRCLLAILMCLSVQTAAHANDLAKGIPSEAALRARMALKLAGLVTFVANSCPGLKPDYTRFKSTLQTLGVSTEDLAKQDMKAEYLGYAARYRDKAKENCARANAEFGPAGRIVPDIFADAMPR